MSKQKLDRMVVSIGNLTVGGTGKTPATIALAKEALRRQLMPCILTRGYKGTKLGSCFVLPDSDVKTVGDEPVLMASKLQGVPIIKGKNRYAAGLIAKEADFFILDDGFQHFKLHRDVDILLVDGKRGFGNGRLLPFGPLREPLGELRRADFVLITKTNDAGQCNLLRKFPKERIFTANHTPAYLINNKGTLYPLKDLLGKTVFAFCAIAAPLAFKESLISIGANIVGFKTFKDHYKYSLRDIESILKLSKSINAELVITTEKDMVKIKEYAKNMLALSIEFSVSNVFYEKVFEKINNREKPF
ncbi:MAG: tetraacyldisaccharide 4'-kinase [Candidatus Magnetoovum sp. WYHC-5]|nr:tetraacyldisaccharide 4'-kinase [Candidatus Magnetoovum sp. WYHC-5]